MIITEKFFKLTPVNDHSLFFDLELTEDFDKPQEEKKFKKSGYGLTLECAIHKIVSYAINKKFKDQEITLKQYLDEFKSVQKDIKKMLS